MSDTDITKISDAKWMQTLAGSSGFIAGILLLETLVGAAYVFTLYNGSESHTWIILILFCVVTLFTFGCYIYVLIKHPDSLYPPEIQQTKLLVGTDSGVTKRTSLPVTGSTTMLPSGDDPKEGFSHE